MVSAYAAKQDWESNDTVIDGKPVKDWLNGYNLRDDGAVVNHNLIHCDYMACIMLNLRAYLTQPLAGQPVSQAARFNANRVYRALVTQDWPSPPYEPPGGTMYIPARPRSTIPRARTGAAIGSTPSISSTCSRTSWVWTGGCRAERLMEAYG